MDQKMQFIADYLRRELSMTELCERYRIARKTGYKLVDRYIKEGLEGLEEKTTRAVADHHGKLFELLVEAVGELSIVSRQLRDQPTVHARAHVLGLLRRTLAILLPRTSEPP